MTASQSLPRLCVFVILLLLCPSPLPRPGTCCTYQHIHTHFTVGQGRSALLLVNRDKKMETSHPPCRCLCRQQVTPLNFSMRENKHIISGNFTINNRSSVCLVSVNIVDYDYNFCLFEGQGSKNYYTASLKTIITLVLDFLYFTQTHKAKCLHCNQHYELIRMINRYERGHQTQHTMQNMPRENRTTAEIHSESFARSKVCENKVTLAPPSHSRCDQINLATASAF